MYKKWQIFYLADASGKSRICEDRIVQARVIAVAEKVIRVEIFGTECSILARDLSWDWLRDATESFHVGDQILVCILSIKIRSLEDISVRADIKSVNGTPARPTSTNARSRSNMPERSQTSVNAPYSSESRLASTLSAHGRYDSRMPWKKG